MKQKEVRLFVRRNKVNLTAICEHKVTQDRENHIINSSLPGWEWCTNANTRKDMGDRESQGR
ncbi:hypothetical protein RDI58_010618 [Solanum bulbocastanum]|uniref:Uncharacterized protein n=1 Tax=Solanum bulbocastanum TaxID=147425 RepID=A0AAN8TU84_SOLBU